ncbi:MAG TPA: hypothetical protein VJ961_06985 [Mariprofundaceae bacterium]|nr:hypothetical protein [Mariprofundaceae bacterium]
MNRSKPFVFALLALLLAGCGSSHHDQDKMKAPLDKIRGMVKQSAVLASQAVCAGPETQPKLLHASVVLLRRAMGGPEMASIHKMMGQMEMDQPGKVPQKQSGMSAEQQMHVDIHSAGEDTFDFLDAISQDHLTCTDVRPVSLAATAALLRESPSAEVNGVVKKLDGDIGKYLGDKTPDSVRTLAQALEKI